MNPRQTAGVIGLGVMWLALRLVPGEAGEVRQPALPATPTPLWAGMLGELPAEFTAPPPATEPSVLDGAYARHTTAPPQWWSCLRCADYRPSGGTWRILLDRGVLRIVYDVTGWRSLASYEVSQDQLRVFNDPICPWEEGRYNWQSEGGRLTLHVVEDTCAFGLRAENLTSGSWSSCAPPDLRAAVSDAWPKPAGCAPARVAPPPDAPSTVAVRIVAGDARKNPSTLAWMAPANADNVGPPRGVEVNHAPDTVPYGLNMVLWEGGRWVEATTDRPAEAVGVQFWGPSTMGIARLLFDGEEVWRGEVAQLGGYLTMYGGYLEVSGFGPGRHTLRVEHLGADERPITVLFFGGR